MQRDLSAAIEGPRTYALSEVPRSIRAEDVERMLGLIDQPRKERAFLFEVARREAGHTRRTYRRRAEVDGVEFDEMPSAAPAVDELVARRQRERQVDELLAEMDSGLRDIFVALASGESSTSEWASRLDIPLGTAKSRWRRARAALEKRLRRARA